ncbi:MULTISPECIES: hypothetical protein [unclassified Corynebacterium]|uniref:hypothetical protein n=1 Tax=unclassified Corynebacterium TaxID=2624378 RepID=UPI00264795BE|nr:hypothetical protein [Corynebacterium sp.]MDN5720992.1 hypothetical protein [Corynebacterium sp.]MDN6259655.1 hypothetical protein [Corynebacterium sp.]
MSQSQSFDAENLEDGEYVEGADNVDDIDDIDDADDEWEEYERQEIPGSSTADVVTLLFMAAMIIATVFCFVFLM